MILWELFLGFLRVGCFSFGGAYSAIPLIRDVVQSYGWLTDGELSYMIAVSESTPGPIMVNLATYVGAERAGILGSAVATAAVVLPAFIIILLAFGILGRFMSSKYVKSALGGLIPCVVGIILAVGIYISAENIVLSFATTRDIIISLCVAAVLSLIAFLSKPVLKKKVSPILLIVISAALGVIAWGV